jgi:hypothetical protein
MASLAIRNSLFTFSFNYHGIRKIFQIPFSDISSLHFGLDAAALF